MNLQPFKDLLATFKKVPKVEVPPPTFMEIAGYPHYENVCSNILAFFFKTDEVHGFGDLFVRSLYECVDKEYSDEPLETIQVQREVSTGSNKRIDILIETINEIFIIENKVWMHLHNDLNDYAEYAEIQVEDKAIHKIVLSPYKIKAKNLQAGFVSLTHSVLLKEIQKKLWQKEAETNSKYLPYLLDFMKTTLNHVKKEKMDKKMLEFFIKNKATIDALNAEGGKLQHLIFNDILLEVKKLVIEPSHTSHIHTYGKSQLIYDFSSADGITLSVETNFSLKGVNIYVWIRKGRTNKTKYISQFDIAKQGYLFHGKRLIVQKHEEMSILTEPQVIATKIEETLNLIKISKDV